MRTFMFNTRAIEKIRPTRVEQIFYDKHTDGLILIVKPNGQKLFCYQQYNGQQLLHHVLGSAFYYNVREARKMVLERFRPSRRESKQENVYFDVFIRTWYLPFAKQYKRSYQTDQSFIKKWLLPVWGGFYLHEINHSMCLSIVYKYRQSHCCASSDRLVILLRQIFKLAKEWGVIHCANPTDGIPLFRIDNKKERFLSLDEIKRLTNAFEGCNNKKLCSIMQFLLLTGARKSEVLESRWQDVDWENNDLVIWRNKSNRVHRIPLSQKAREILDALPRDSDYIFSNPYTHLPYKNFYKTWQNVCKKAGLEGLRIHDLRHSFASLLVNAGKNLYEVQRILGHSDHRSTQRYAHLHKDKIAEHVNYVGSLL